MAAYYELAIQIHTNVNFTKTHTLHKTTHTETKNLLRLVERDNVVIGLSVGFCDSNQTVNDGVAHSNI